MSLIRLRDMEKRYKDNLVLREVYFRLSEGERVGLIGKNGSGKTTLLRLILGREEPSSGEVDLDRGLRLGYFSQFSTLDGTMTVEEVLRDVFAPVLAMEEELLEVEIALEEAEGPEEMERLIHRQARLIEAMNRCDGWNYQVKIDTALTRLGFSKEHRTRPIEQLSGGWRNRAALAKILLEQPDVLLMDEPTNFLDVAGLTWLEEWLQDFCGGAIVVSHDRDFIDHVATRIVEIENYHLHDYSGNFQQYVREKQLRIKTLERQFVHEEELLVYEAQAIDDREEARRNPSKALQRKLADIKKRGEPRPVDRIITDLYRELRVPERLCDASYLTKAYDEQMLFRDLTLSIHRQDHLAILGPNGCGKTTLIRVLTEREAPDNGTVAWRKGADYVDFNRTFRQLDPDDTVSHAVNVVGLAYAAPRKKVHEFLSLLRFSEMDLYQRIGTLSGGQRARVALAQCLLSGAAAIFLDEPTNHLDLTTTQVMERALTHFPGAVIVASHDRFFIDKIANRLLIFQDEGEIRLFNGNWTLYQIAQERAREDRA